MRGSNPTFLTIFRPWLKQNVSPYGNFFLKRYHGLKIPFNNLLAIEISKMDPCYPVSKMNCQTLFLQTCQRYCLQKDITRECQCFHPNLVVAMVNSTFNKRPCLITPDNNSKILHIIPINTET